MSLENIVIRGAREHNLKNVDITIPRDKLVVITGPSGSGKSTLAFDTIYAEGQRRYVESLSAYARQFLGRMDKPDVEYIEGLSPSISIDQKGVSNNPRSTVGTVTEIYDYLRLLYARVGNPHCYKCGRPVQRQTVQQISEIVLSQQGRRLMLLAPVVTHKKGEHKEVFEDARNAGFVRVRVDNEIIGLDSAIILDKQKWHTIEIIVDRLVLEPETERSRITDSVETALHYGQGTMLTVDADSLEEQVYSEKFACADCQISFGEIEPRTFSFNSPHGACSTCTGLGLRLVIDPDLVIEDPTLSINQGSIKPWARSMSSVNAMYFSILRSVAIHENVSADTPWRDLPPKTQRTILYGFGDNRKIKVRHRTRRGRQFEWDSGFEGVIPNLERRYKETQSDYMRNEIERYMTALPCESCKGNRLRPEALAVTICDRSIIQTTNLSVADAYQWVYALQQNASTLKVKPRWEKYSDPPYLSPRDQLIAAQILKEISSRLSFLSNVGLDYLSLSRSASTLSGGEGQRIRLATQIGSGLMGVLYVCDEPSVGLHPVDNHRLIGTLKELRNLGNTVLIVEHDEAMMRSADFLIDMGPGAGENGGRVVAKGTIHDIENNLESSTGAFLSKRKTIPLPAMRRVGNGKFLTVKGATENNLRNVNVSFPLGKLICVTGVSGSGKSTLVYEILYKWLAQKLYHAKDKPGSNGGVEGLENIDKVVNIDQSPIGRTPRSNPATYTGTFTPIRELFAALPESKARGFMPGRFSFNVKGGRCESCQGDGYIQIQMQFLPDVTVPCEVCEGRRYNEDALEIKFKEKSIADVLAMTVTEAHSLFSNIPRINSKLETLEAVGLGYIRLGQPATTLSGGEAQRIKLASELSKRATGKTLYILDEPTTGLSFQDAAHLLEVLHRLVEGGNTIVLIEHHLDLIKNADWIIDLGPGPGTYGGKIVGEGTPEEIVQIPDSQTANFLQELL